MDSFRESQTDNAASRNFDNLMGNSPYAFIMNKVWEQYKENTNTFYRMFTYHDFFCICQRLYNIYQEWDDLEVFYEGYNNVIREIQTDFGGVKGIPKLERDSPCKRICLFLRWVVRKSPVDLGIWNIIHPTELYIPLDAHVAKMAHQLGITTRKTEDWKMVQQVTNYMKTIFPDDRAGEILHYSDIVLTINNLHYVRT